MAWKLYEPEKPRPTDDPTVTITKERGELTFKKATWEALGGPHQVQLLFDPDEGRVGVQPVDKWRPSAINVKPTRKGRHYQVWAAKGFLRKHGIPHDETRRYDAEIVADPDGPMLVFDLNRFVASTLGGSQKHAKA